MLGLTTSSPCTETRQAAMAALLQHSCQPAPSAADTLKELQEMAGQQEGDAPDDDTDLVELQSWGRRGQKQVDAIPAGTADLVPNLAAGLSTPPLTGTLC